MHKLLILVAIFLNLSACGIEELGEMLAEDSQAPLVNGKTCNENTDCASLSCRSGASSLKFCYGHAEVGDTCTTTYDCTDTKCNNGVCAELLENGEVCVYEEHMCKSENCAEALSGIMYCYGDGIAGDSCTITQDCVNTLCYNSVCRVRSYKQDGETCDEDWDCDSLQCAMSRSGYKVCFGHQAIGDNCTVTQNCADGICPNGICVEQDYLDNGEICSEDWHCDSWDCSLSTNGNWYCYGDAAIGDSCTISQDCAGGICPNGICVERNYLENGEICVEDWDCDSLNCAASAGGTMYCYGDAAIGESCFITQDCATGICPSGICVVP